jgi:hypothetical protein
MQSPSLVSDTLRAPGAPDVLRAQDNLGWLGGGRLPHNDPGIVLRGHPAAAGSEAGSLLPGVNLGVRRAGINPPRR